ncbi:hypothetical protein D3C80_2086560 [compost metagenome]
MLAVLFFIENGRALLLQNGYGISIKLYKIEYAAIRFESVLLQSNDHIHMKPA